MLIIVGKGWTVKYSGLPDSDEFFAMIFIFGMIYCGLGNVGRIFESTFSHVDFASYTEYGFMVANAVMLVCFYNSRA